MHIGNAEIFYFIIGRGYVYGDRCHKHSHVAMFTATVVNIRPLDGATVETDIRQYIRQHPNKHVTF